MSFYEDLKNYRPEPPGRERSPEALMEERIWELTQDEGIQKIAEDMLRKIKENCREEARRGRRRLFGYLRGYRSESYDPEGYSHPPDHYSQFVPWTDHTRQISERQTFDPRAMNRVYVYDSYEDQQAIMRVLEKRMRQEGFPEGVLTSSRHTITWHMAEDVPQSWRQAWQEYDNTWTESIVTEVDIRW